MIGCSCETCRSADPRDNRSRPSVHLALPDGTSVLIDTSPDLRLQALRFDLLRIDAILFTHGHADHVMGFDEVRRFNVLQGAEIPCYGDAGTLEEVRRTFAYAFRNNQDGGGVPEVRLFPVAGPFSLGGEAFVPVPLLHGRSEIFGYRVGPLAYLTDCNGIPETSWPLLEGVRLLVIDALRERPHPTHFTVREALDVVERLSPDRAWFTHVCHDLPHAATCARLPKGVELAYDGLVLQFDLGGMVAGPGHPPRPAILETRP
jgi:phosphoribosyl 1,2-cyclic phosphate phosphodiesterase